MQLLGRIDPELLAIALIGAFRTISSIWIGLLEPPNELTGISPPPPFTGSPNNPVGSAKNIGLL